MFCAASGMIRNSVVLSFEVAAQNVLKLSSGFLIFCWKFDEQPFRKQDSISRSMPATGLFVRDTRAEQSRRFMPQRNFACKAFSPKFF